MPRKLISQMTPEERLEKKRRNRYLKAVREHKKSHAALERYYEDLRDFGPAREDAVMRVHEANYYE